MVRQLTCDWSCVWVFRAFAFWFIESWQRYFMGKPHFEKQRSGISTATQRITTHQILRGERIAKICRT